MIGRIQKWCRKRKYKDDIIINDQSFFVPKMVKTQTLIVNEHPATDLIGRPWGMPHHFIGMSGSIGSIEHVDLFRVYNRALSAAEVAVIAKDASILRVYRWENQTVLLAYEVHE